MTDIQKKVLKLLQEDARYSAKHIAAALGEDETAVKDAIATLEKEGVIVKYAALVNGVKEGGVQAIIEVKVAPQKLKGFDSYAEDLYNFSEVKDLMLVSGGFDLFITVESTDLAGVAEFISEKLSVIDGIVGVATHFILKKYKVDGAVVSVPEESKRQIIQA
ncbi:MAG: Lrp/AsnC family transcriptional regulator [Clostridia bacterium]|nr:Lrp/AsnC family transcriptional regulator [Clostridia bacterium]